VGTNAEVGTKSTVGNLELCDIGGGGSDSGVQPMYRYSSAPQAVGLYQSARKGERERSVGKGRESSEEEREGIKGISQPKRTPWKRISDAKGHEHLHELLAQAGRAPVDVSANLVEQVDAKHEIKHVTTTTQTATFNKRPQSPPFAPPKIGIDRGTQILDQAELFNFETELNPILDVLVTKTLEQALVEVQQEVEIDILANAEEFYVDERVRLRQEQEDLENKARLNHAEKEALKKKQIAWQKHQRNLATSTLASSFCNECIVESLEVATTARVQSISPNDQIKEEIRNEFLPWLESKIQTISRARAESEGLLSKILKDVILKQRQKALRRSFQRAQQQMERQRRQEMVEEEERAREEMKNNTIEVFLCGQDLFGIDLVGPIDLLLTDTMQEAEIKIAEWVQKQEELHNEIPQGGYLPLALTGDPLEENASTTLSLLKFAPKCCKAKC